MMQSTKRNYYLQHDLQADAEAAVNILVGETGQTTC